MFGRLTRSSPFPEMSKEGGIIKEADMLELIEENYEKECIVFAAAKFVT